MTHRVVCLQSDKTTKGAPMTEQAALALCNKMTKQYPYYKFRIEQVKA